MKNKTDFMNKTINKYLLIVFLVFMVIVAACGKQTVTGKAVQSAKTSQASPEVTVTIAYLPVIQGLPLYLAIEKGYFKEEGIDVEAIKFDSPNLILQALVSGQVDFGSPSTAAGITAVADYANPGQLKIYAVGGSAFAESNGTAVNEAIIVKKNSSIETIADLKGKKIGILPSIQWRTITRHMLAQNGLVMDKDYTPVELAAGLQVQALAAGQVDAVVAIEPVATIARLQGISKEIAHAAVEQYISDPFYGGAGVLRIDFAKENPETTAKVLKVFARAIEEINQNPSAARKYLKGYTPLDEKLSNELPGIIFKMYPDFTEKDVQALQQFFDVFAQHKVIGGRVDAKQLVYQPSLE